MKTTFVLLYFLIGEVWGFQNLFPRLSVNQKSSNGGKSSKQLEVELLKAIEELGVNRLANSEKIKKLILRLESKESIRQPAIAPEIYGRWRLLHTDNANTASPIQRKAVELSSFPIYQDITFNSNNQLVVSQVVKFRKNLELKVDALASSSAYPLPEFTERKGDGKIFGLNLLGVSSVGDQAVEDPTRPDSRIDFVFDEGNFDLGGFTVPYPVPFRLPILRDAVKGWIDITYLSDRLRISRGNKGTTFVLLKEEDTR